VSYPVHRLLAVAALSAAAAAAQGSAGLARNEHFEVYAQAGPADAHTVLIELERLRAYFLQQTGLGVEGRPPVRLIVFRSAEEYAPYELRPTADAYYVGTESRDIIILPAMGDHTIQVAAHELAHVALHANVPQLPPWLNEGLSELFSAVQLTERGNQSGAQVPPRARILENRAWMPLRDLVLLPADSPLREQRETVDLFYSESWALADLLMASPAYHARFAELLNLLASGVPSDRALATVYGRSLDDIAGDLHRWLEKRRITPQVLPPAAVAEAEIAVSEISPRVWRSVLADLLLASGKLERARDAFEQLAREEPGNPDFSAALATIDLGKGDPAGARERWQRALDQGLRDAAACYRYAVLAGNAGLPANDVRPALERAVAVQPVFDDAHYMLGLLEGNTGRYESAIAQFLAMRAVAPARQYPYWISLADAYNHLDRREEAKAAARRAREHAATAEERAHAAELFEIADTDLTARFAPDANGVPRLVMTRIPHDERNWNPFIEPADQIRRVEGKLRRIECGRDATRIVVEAATGLLTLTIADPSRVQMLHAPEEFVCGPQNGNPVIVIYAAGKAAGKSEGIIRSMEFQ